MFRASSEEQHGYPSIASASVTSSTNTGKELAAEKAGIATLSAQELAQTSSELFSKGDKKIAKHVTPLLKSSPKPTSLIQGAVPKETAIATHAHLVHPHGLCPEKERALKELYERLDMDNDGTIDIRDLTAALKHEMPHIPYRLAPKLLARIRRREDDDAVNFSDFVHYVIEHEKRLELIFQDLDRNQDGYIDVREIKEYCHELGIPISDARAQNIVEKMDQTGSAAIDLSEFQQFMLLYPSSDPRDIADFWRHNLLKRVIQRLKGDGELTIYERFLAGSSAGAISQTAIYPMEVLKTRLALRRTGQLDHGVLHFAKKMYEQEGLRCFYKGYIPNLLGIIPYAGIDLAVYETLKTLYVRRNKDVTEPGVLALVACGACSSTCGQLASYPLALIRTRLQAKTVAKDRSQPDTMSGQFRFILKNEGVVGLYRGITPNFMKVIPAIMIQSPLTIEEKSLREKYERLKAIRKAISAAKNPPQNSKETHKISDRVSKKSNVEVAAVAAEEVKRKIISGAIRLSKASEKNTFKRLKVSEKRPSLEKTPSLSQNDAVVLAQGCGSETEPMFSPPYSSQEPRYPRPPQQVNPTPTRGPTLYVRGTELSKDVLEHAFHPFGTINRCFVEERRKSAFITFSSTEQAEEAIAKMDDKAIDGRTVRVSFARRQNQSGFRDRQQRPSVNRERTISDTEKDGTPAGFRKRPGLGANKGTDGPTPLRRWAPSTSTDSSAPPTPITPTVPLARVQFQKFVPAGASQPEIPALTEQQVKEREVVTYDDSCPFD
ncbi:hypothetical protein QR680_017560 [Steinernema hermaphroditum]|uniref:Uncharacterized protein n=1 Tax=Steinernema hermaphroditum TaxID=289476 RepID=A0AA39HF19_9BILA|nr:hypothetical protein QR680_017560 [Steinernema hermaphroditum]